MQIDLNCDLAEGVGLDHEIIPWITSANIACGFHAGDRNTIFQATSQCLKHQVSIGCHPGYDDRPNFGRTEINHIDAKLLSDLLYQIGGMIGIVQFLGGTVKYIKPHGALYHQACRDSDYARTVIHVAESFQLPILALPESMLQRELQLHAPELSYFREGFADRRYRPDGSLVPRTEADAFIHDPREAVEQIHWLISHRNIQSICVHGDHPQAVEFVRKIRESLVSRGYQLRSFQ